MDIIMTIADIAGAIGMLFFFLAELSQLRKIKRTGHVTGLSYTTYRSKLAALGSTLVCFALPVLWFSFTILFCELVVVLKITKRIKNERGTK